MSTSIDQAWVQTFGSDVKLAYQRQGSRLRTLVRQATDVKDKHRFFKLGKGTASDKARHGLVPTMNAAHTYVDVTVVDKYAGDWVDVLDLSRINIDERQILAKTGAYALGRVTDDQIIAAIQTSPGAAGAHGGTGMTKAKALALLQTFNVNDVPDDGERFVAVGPKAWNDLLGITEFVSGDYVGQQGGQMPIIDASGGTPRRWLGFWWMMHSALGISGTVSNIAWHRTAVGHATGVEIKPDVTWHGDRAAWFINNMMQMQAITIDNAGTYVIETQ